MIVSFVTNRIWMLAVNIANVRSKRNFFAKQINSKFQTLSSCIIFKNFMLFSIKKSRLINFLQGAVGNLSFK